MAPKVQANNLGAPENEPKAGDEEDAGAKRKAEDEGETSAAKVPKVEEEPELEEDAKDDKRKKITREVFVDTRDATLNVIPTSGGVLMALSDSGLAYLLSGGRSNTGVKAGRYFFEARIFETVAGGEGGRRGHHAPTPKQQVRVGFSTSASTLLLGEDDEGVCFDAEGFFTAERRRRPGGARFGREQVVGVLLNLEKGHPNADTVSLFKGGRRATKPMPLPEALKGKTLYPHVSFRNVTLHVHFGVQPMFPLPFKCRMLQDAAQADVEALPEAKPGAKQYEVVFPISLPDEGTFDWLDTFMETHEKHMELSDRRIVEWACKSGIGRPRTNQQKNSNDKPDAQFGIYGIDDMATRKVLLNVAPLVPRDYVVMEVKSNLIKSERKELLGRFRMPHFKKVAKVMIGTPPAEFVKAAHERLLQDKQERLNYEWQAKKAEKEKLKAKERKEKEMAELRKKMMEEKQKREEAEAAAKADGEEGAEGGEKPDGSGTKDEEVKEEVKAEVKEEGKDEAMPEEAKEGGPDADAEMEDADLEPPKAELTEEEKRLKFRPVGVPDLLPAVLGSNFGSFSIPTKDEEFDEIVFEWDNEQKATEYLRTWIKNKKRTMRVEDIQPSEQFFTKLNEWAKLNSEWQAKQKSWMVQRAQIQEPIQREKARKKAEREMKKEARAKKKALEEEAAQKAAEESKAGEEKEAEKPADEEATESKEEAKKEEKKDEVPEDKKEEAAPDGEKKDEAAPEEKKAEEEDEASEEEAEEKEETPVDVDSVEDILDVRDGEPLFANFQMEDWALLSLRFESNMLVKFFKRDVNDPERPGMHESHLPFYYQKYFRKVLNLKIFGVSTWAELFSLIKDTVTLDSESILVNTLTEDTGDETAKFDTLVKLTETARRLREQKIEAGDETAKLKFSPLAAAMGSRQPGETQHSFQHPGGDMTRPPMVNPPPQTVHPPKGGKGGPYSGGWQSGQGKWGGGKGFGKGYRPPARSWGSWR